jgi:hypothetical protein
MKVEGNERGTRMNWKSLCLVMVLTGAFSQIPAIAADLPHYDRAALVNGVLITRADFHTELSRLERLRAAGDKVPDPVETARLKKEALENLINRELLFQEASREGIRAPGAEVDEEINGLKKQFAQDSEYLSTLGEMGLSEASIRDQITRGMTINKFIDDRFGKKVMISDADIEYYYDGHREEFKAAGQKPAAFAPLSEAREMIRRKIRQERVERELSPYVKQLRNRAKVEVLLDE